MHMSKDVVNRMYQKLCELQYIYQASRSSYKMRINNIRFSRVGKSLSITLKYFGIELMEQTIVVGPNVASLILDLSQFSMGTHEMEVVGNMFVFNSLNLTLADGDSKEIELSGEADFTLK